MGTGSSQQSLRLCQPKATGKSARLEQQREHRGPALQHALPRRLRLRKRFRDSLATIESSFLETSSRRRGLTAEEALSLQ